MSPLKLLQTKLLRKIDKAILSHVPNEGPMRVSFMVEKTSFCIVNTLDRLKEFRAKIVACDGFCAQRMTKAGYAKSLCPSRPSIRRPAAMPLQVIGRYGHGRHGFQGLGRKRPHDPFGGVSHFGADGETENLAEYARLFGDNQSTNKETFLCDF